MNLTTTNPAPPTRYRYAMGPKPVFDTRRGNTEGMNPDLVIFSVLNPDGEAIAITCGYRQHALPPPAAVPQLNSPDA
jgi:hypothetical protein